MEAGKVKFQKLSIYSIYVDKIEYAVVDGKVLNTSDAKAFVKSFRDTKKVASDVRTLSVFTDMYNYRVGFRNGEFLFEKACKNASIKDNIVVKPSVVNERRSMLLVQDGEITMAISRDYFNNKVKEYTVNTKQDASLDEFIFNTETGEQIVPKFPLDFIFNDATTDFKVVKYLENEKEVYALHFDAEVDTKIYTVLFKGNGTMKEAERSLSNFLKEV
jgi:hypothetical protein